MVRCKTSTLSASFFRNPNMGQTFQLTKSLEAEPDSSLLEIMHAVEHIISHFKGAKGYTAFSIPDELEDVVDYAHTYLSISQTPYRKDWYKLCTCPDFKKWPNILIIMELCFSLPFSNGRVEQIFSRMKVVKTNRRTKLAANTLNDLLEIYVEGPPLADFCPDEAIGMILQPEDVQIYLNQEKLTQQRVHLTLQLLVPVKLTRLLG